MGHVDVGLLGGNGGTHGHGTRWVGRVEHERQDATVGYVGHDGQGAWDAMGRVCRMQSYIVCECGTGNSKADKYHAEWSVHASCMDHGRYKSVMTRSASGSDPSPSHAQPSPTPGCFSPAPDASRDLVLPHVSVCLHAVMITIDFGTGGGVKVLNYSGNSVVG